MSAKVIRWSIAVTTLLAAASASAANLYEQDFETNTAGISGAGFTYATSGYGALGFGATMFRNWESGDPAPATVVSFNLAGATTSVALDFDLAVIDSWDGDSSLGGCCNTDRFTVNLDGVTVFSADFNNVWTFVAGFGNSVDTQTFPRDQRMLAGPVANLAGEWNGDAGPDSAYRLNVALGDLAAGTHTLEFFAGGPGWQAFQDESFAIDNIRVSTPVPLPPAALLMAGGLLGLRFRRQRHRNDVQSIARNSRSR